MDPRSVVAAANVVELAEIDTSIVEVDFAAGEELQRVASSTRVF